MGAHSHWGTTPRASIEAACQQRGREVVVQGCLDLLAGGDADGWLVRALGGPRAAGLLDAPLPQRYWLRVWAARGLRWAWDERAGEAVIAALDDEAWRVREMAAKVAGARQVDAALEPLVGLARDPSARVRAAAERALVLLTQAGVGQDPWLTNGL